MADTKISALPELTGANTASADMIPIVDQSAVQTKKITLGELQAAPVSAGTANGVLFLNGSKVATSGSALTFDTNRLTVGAAGAAGFQSFISTGVADGFDIGLLGGDGDTSAYILNRASGTLVFGTNNAEGMRLTSTGLGIGTSSPGYKLQVAGIAGVKVSDGNAAEFHINNTSASARDWILLSTGASWAGGGQAGNLAIYDGTANQQRLTLDTSGNLGLGVTPSPLSIAARTFEIAYKGNALMSASDGMSMISNCYYDSNWKYGYNGPAASYVNSNGLHRWYVAPSGTAGDTFSFSQVMTLDASGRLLLGLTGSIGLNSALQVIGGAQFSSSQGANSVVSAVDFWNTNSSGFNVARIEVATGTNIYEGVLKFYTKDSGGTLGECTRLDSSGNLIQKVNAAAPGLTVNGTMSFELTSNTSLKIVVRGSDGITRSASLTLA